MYTVYLLHVSATILAVLRVMNYTEHTRKLFEPMHKQKRSIFKMYGLKYSFECKMQITFL
jgi:hypothetical protein